MAGPCNVPWKACGDDGHAQRSQQLQGFHKEELLGCIIACIGLAPLHTCKEVTRNLSLKQETCPCPQGKHRHICSCHTQQRPALIPGLHRKERCSTPLCKPCTPALPCKLHMGAAFGTSLPGDEGGARLTWVSSINDEEGWSSDQLHGKAQAPRQAASLRQLAHQVIRGFLQVQQAYHVPHNAMPLQRNMLGCHSSLGTQIVDPMLQTIYHPICLAMLT